MDMKGDRLEFQLFTIPLGSPRDLSFSEEMDKRVVLSKVISLTLKVLGYISFIVILFPFVLVLIFLFLRKGGGKLNDEAAPKTESKQSWSLKIPINSDE